MKKEIPRGFRYSGTANPVPKRAFTFIMKKPEYLSTRMRAMWAATASPMIIRQYPLYFFLMAFRSGFSAAFTAVSRFFWRAFIHSPQPQSTATDAKR